MYRTLLSIISLFIFSTAGASVSLYEQHMQLGRMFQKSGNLLLAEQNFLKALDNADEQNAQDMLNAELSLVDVMKLQRPIEAQRMNDRLEQACRKQPGYLQRHLAMNCFICFRLNNKPAFNKSYEQYVALCRDHEDLPTTFDAMLQAMHEALDGYCNDALRTLADPGIDNLTRHDLRIAIFEHQADTMRLLNELRQRALTVDSLGALMYEQNLSEVSNTSNMTRAQQQAEKKSSNLLLLLAGLLAVVIGMVLLLLHIRKRSRQQLDQKNDQLKTALKMAGETEQMKKEFVRRISHEIRTPLNAITGFNDILNNTDIELSKEDRSDLMARINESVKAITVIADELLQQADAESVVDYAKNDTVYCNQFFRDLLYKHSDEVNANTELRFTTRVINRDTILTNTEAVQKIVEHLISNAIKFTQQGSIELNCREEDGMLYVAVTDTGRGVPADMQDGIFEQFSKVDENQQGIGLGLTVSRNMAQKMGGDLTLDKDYTEGARFVLTLPIA